MNKQKKTNGITLIALVITIVVLIILAGVSLNLILGQDGIVNKAKQSSEENKKAQALEEMTLIIHDLQIEFQGNATLSNLATKLQNDTENTYILATDAKVASLTVQDGRGLIELTSITDETEAIFVTNLKYGYEIRITKKFELSLTGTTVAYQEPETPTPVSPVIGKTDAEILEEIQTTATLPYLPTGFSITEESKLDEANKETTGGALEKGLVITDGVNEFVWVQVPKIGGPDYTNVASSIDYENIRNALISYVTSYRKTNYEDYWYYLPNRDVTYSIDPLTEIKYKYNGTTLNTTTDDINTEYNNCGLNYSEYKEYYKAMLKSVYENGGFYIGKYETGYSLVNEQIARGSSSDDTSNYIAKIQRNLYPYNYLTVSQAENIAEGINSGNQKSSLMFGIQWDLTLKYLENKIGANNLIVNNKNILTQNSSIWGNYNDNNDGNYTISSNATAKQAVTSPYNIFSSITGTKTTTGLLTTGASDLANKFNISDLAGNVWEWTLEADIGNATNVSSSRGGNFRSSGSSYANYHDHWEPTVSTNHIGFRISIY